MVGGAIAETAANCWLVVVCGMMLCSHNVFCVGGFLVAVDDVDKIFAHPVQRLVGLG